MISPNIGICALAECCSRKVWSGNLASMLPSKDVWARLTLGETRAVSSLQPEFIYL